MTYKRISSYFCINKSEYRSSSLMHIVATPNTTHIRTTTLQWKETNTPKSKLICEPPQKMASAMLTMFRSFASVYVHTFANVKFVWLWSKNLVIAWNQSTPFHIQDKGTFSEFGCFSRENPMKPTRTLQIAMSLTELSHSWLNNNIKLYTFWKRLVTSHATA